MRPIKRFVNKNKWLVIIFNFVFVFLPQWLDSILSLSKNLETNILWVYWITAPIGLIIFGILIWAIRSEKAKPDVRNCLRNILIKIHKKDNRLKDKAVKQYLQLFTSDDFKQFLKVFQSAFMGKNHEELISEVKKEIGRKKLSPDKIKARKQIDNLADKLSPITMDWTIDEGITLANLIDKLPNEQNQDYKGIKTLRKEDKQWNKLFRELNELKIDNSSLFGNETLRKMVDKYLEYSFLCGSIYLFTDLINKLIPVELQSTDYFSSGTYSPDVDMENRMTELLRAIDNRIDELVSE